jgi:glycosyltransferase involved in cell wall biosynthesis
MRDHAGGEYTIAVWDNGSCEALTDWIRDWYKPEVFIQSINIGKTAARYRLAKMFEEHIISICDDDIFFYPNWLKPQLEILGKFPNTAQVSGYPVRTQFRWGVTNTHLWGAKHGKMQAGKFIPEQWENDFCVSIGRDPLAHKKNTINDFDYRVEWQGLQAYATAHHCQFIARAGNVVKATRLDGEAMGADRGFDNEMDKLGLRLCAVQRLTRHMGNVIDEALRKDIQEAG